MRRTNTTVQPASDWESREGKTTRSFSRWIQHVEDESSGRWKPTLHEHDRGSHHNVITAYLVPEHFQQPHQRQT